MNRTLEPFGQFNLKAFDGLKEKSVRFISAITKLRHYSLAPQIFATWRLTMSALSYISGWRTDHFT